MTKTHIELNHTGTSLKLSSEGSSEAADESSDDDYRAERLGNTEW